ncbi:hypothetical protein V5799_016929 [Amblyomma americanum]|uniref:Uncharacterized protein n=1 Tax=Amblyomma americanum TaxID=6943 RepID=A0AAQ4F3K1_AMBAM
MNKVHSERAADLYTKLLLSCEVTDYYESSGIWSFFVLDMVRLHGGQTQSIHKNGPFVLKEECKNNDCLNHTWSNK